jgi:putative spermidine/putrescine transport system substrate-binding protein
MLEKCIIKLNRRQFLTRSALGTALGQGLMACTSSPSAATVLFLKNSIPPQLIHRFQAQVAQGKDLTFKPEAQLKQLFEFLKDWQDKTPEPQGLLSHLPFIGNTPKAIAALTTTGDSWLQDAIVKGLIQPLNLQAVPSWQKLGPRWHQLVTRDRQGFLSDQGEIWGAPYRWGTTLIVYRREKFQDWGWTPKDWSDLWRPELKQQIAMLDQPREVIGLTLKKLGYSYNTPDLEKVTDLKANLQTLQKQVKFYSNGYYLQALQAKDVAAAVGWSNEILPLLVNNPDLAAVIPASGTALWADLWVTPKNASSNPSWLSAWLDFCWQPESANQIAFFSDGSSPRLETLAPEAVIPAVRNNPLLTLSADLWKRCQFLAPLSARTQQQYLRLWQEMRTTQ